jgi:heterodisulfide reductase subunit B
MKYALFLGCTIPARQMNYEQSARAVAKALGIELVDLDFGCCGFPIEPVDEVKALSMAAINLKRGEKEGLDIVTLCSACGEMLAKAEEVLGKDESMAKSVNGVLSKQLGTEYGGERPRVIHFARMLYEDLGPEKIRGLVKRSLQGLSVATHPGCHYVRPSTLSGGFDDPEFPHSLDELVEATGAEAVDYAGKKDCCGGSILAVREDISKAMTRKKLETLSGKVDAMVLICPFCGIMYDRYQKLMGAEMEKEFGVPVLYYPQLLGLALGIDPEELGFDVNSVSIDRVLEKAGA